MLATVGHLLADEPGHLSFELGIGDLLAEVAHRPHEEVLAGREGRGQDRHQVAHHQVAVDVVPVEAALWVREADPPGAYVAVGYGVVHGPTVERAEPEGKGICDMMSQILLRPAQPRTHDTR